MSALSMFIPLTKVDVEKRLVYGIATAEVKDRSGEVCDYALSKPNFEKWSAEAHAASGGLSKGNLRAMHGKVAAGKFEEIHFNDASKQIEVCAKVVDDGEWKKVIEGVYTGFSQGGAYGKRWTDENGVKRYEAKPNEISLVDLPCLATATFSMVKGEGVEPEIRHFAEAVTVQPPTNDKVAEKAAALAKAAGREDFGGFLEAARDELIKAMLPPPSSEADSTPAPGELAANAPKPQGDPKPPGDMSDAKGDAGGKQMWVSERDKSVHATKADMRRHHAMLDAQADAKGALDAVKSIGKAVGDDATPLSGKLVKAVGADALVKGLSSVSRLASILQDLQWLQQNVQTEATREGDGSKVPGSITDAAKALGEALKAMTAEEVDEMFTPAMTAGIPTPDYYYNAAGLVPDADLDALVKFVETSGNAGAAPTLAKLGMRHSAKDMAKIQAMHDKACELGAACKQSEKAAQADDLQKRASDLEKRALDAEARAEMSDFKYDALKTITDTIPDQMAAMRKMIEDQPRPAHLIGRAVTKDRDAGGTEPPAMDADALAKALESMSQDEKALLFTKAALSRPMKLGG